MLTNYARKMVLEWGMSRRLGFINLSGDDQRESIVPERDYSEETARVIDEEVRAIIDHAYGETERMIESNWDKVVAVAEALLRYETLQADEVDRLLRGERMEKPTVADLLSAETNSTDTPTPKDTPRANGEEPDTELPGILPTPA